MCGESVVNFLPSWRPLLTAQHMPSFCFPSACIPVFQEQKFIFVQLTKRELERKVDCKEVRLFLQHLISDYPLGVANWKVMVITYSV